MKKAVNVSISVGIGIVVYFIFTQILVADPNYKCSLPKGASEVLCGNNTSNLLVAYFPISIIIIVGVILLSFFLLNRANFGNRGKKTRN